MTVYFVEITFSPHYKGEQLVNKYLVQAESSFEARSICKQDIRSVNGRETKFYETSALLLPGVTCTEELRLI